MPPTLIPAPAFISSPADDTDFDADFDLPEGATVIAPSIPVVMTLPPNRITAQDDMDGDSWDDEFEPNAFVLTPPRPQAAPAASSRGTITHLASAKISISGAPPVAEDNWDDDEDFDLPPLTSKPLKLSLSPRTKVRMENTAFGTPDNVGLDQDGDDDPGNASTIKVSRLAMNAALANSSSKTIPPQTPPKMAPSPPASNPPEDDDDGFEDDIVIPNTLSHLSLKPLALLTHRASKASLDGWGDSTSSTMFSDASSGTLSQPSPGHSSASAPSTEDESDDLVDEENEFDGLEMPDSLSSKDMQRILEDKKKGLVFESKDAVRVARPSDAEDDFEMGLVIGTDEDLSPSRLKGQVLSAKRPGKGMVRTMSEPQNRSTTSNNNNLPNPTQGMARPPSRLREEILSSGRTSRESARSPTLMVPPAAPIPRHRPSTESFPSLRRAPSNIIGSSKPPPTRWQTLSMAVRPSPSLTLQPNVLPRPASPTKTPILPANSPSPYPRSPSPMSTTSSTTRFQTQSSTASSSRPPIVKHQKSFSKLPSQPSAGPSAQRMARKASLSSLVDSKLSPTSPSVSPDIPFPSGRLTLRRAPSRGGLSHAQSYRDLGGAAATVGPSSSGTPLERKKYAYEAPTVASRVRRAATSTKSGTMSDGGAMSGSDRERDRPPLPSNTTARTITRSRGAISNIFPGATLHAQQPSSSSLYARSPSPQLAVPLPRKHRNSTAPTPSPPAARVLRRPKKSRNFGDGTELDSIEDLAVEREKESKFRVAPTGRGNVGQKKQPVTVTTGPTGTIGRRRGAAEATARSVSSASSQGAIDPPPRQVPSLRRQQRIEFPRTDPVGITAATPTSRRRKDIASGTPTSLAARKKPTLIKNLGGAGSPKVVGDMKWNPKTLKWEGNDAVLREFDLSSSARPALITHLTGSSVGGLGSPQASFSNGNVRVVGEMMFDPIKMCWLSCTGEDEEDPFADIDEEDEADWDADGKGGTIRAVLTTTTTGTLSVGSRRESTMSSEGSSPARSIRGSGSHGRSASESDSESVTCATTTAGGRESSLGAMGTIDEHMDDGTVPLPRDLILACGVAEERHRSEMKGWSVAVMQGGAPRRRSHPPPEEQDRSYLWDIRALATRSF